MYKKLSFKKKSKLTLAKNAYDHKAIHIRYNKICTILYIYYRETVPDHPFGKALQLGLNFFPCRLTRPIPTYF